MMGTAGPMRAENRVFRSCGDAWHHTWNVVCERVHDCLTGITLSRQKRLEPVRDGAFQDLTASSVEMTPEEAISVGYRLLEEGMDMIKLTDKRRQPYPGQEHVPFHAAMMFDEMKRDLETIVEDAGGNIGPGWIVK